MKKLPYLLIAALILLSCKKDKKNCDVSMTSLAGDYKFTAATYKASASAQEQDYLSTAFDPCEKDDIVTLKSDGTYTNTDAGTVCNPPENFDGTWSVTGNTITIDGSGSTVQSFNCKELIITQSDVVTTGDQVKFTLTKQ